VTANHNPDAFILDEKLAALFVGAVGGAVESLRVLRESICMYVETERARGTSLDVVIAKVSTMLERVRHHSAETDGIVPDPTPAERELAKEIVSWCIDSYLPKKARKQS
jgi:hypothetical protein